MPSQTTERMMQTLLLGIAAGHVATCQLTWGQRAGSLQPSDQPYSNCSCICCFVIQQPCSTNPLLSKCVQAVYAICAHRRPAGRRPPCSAALGLAAAAAAGCHCTRHLAPGVQDAQAGHHNPDGVHDDKVDPEVQQLGAGVHKACEKGWSKDRRVGDAGGGQRSGTSQSGPT